MSTPRGVAAPWHTAAMGNDDPDSPDESTEAALSLPSLGFGRKRRKGRAEPADGGADDGGADDRGADDRGADGASTVSIDGAPAEAASTAPVAEAEQPTHRMDSEETVEQPVAAGVRGEPTRAPEPTGAARWASITSAYDAAHVGSTAPEEQTRRGRGAGR